MLVYDADCGPCSIFKSGVDWLDLYNRLRFISLADADEQGLLNSIPRWRRHKSFHIISPGDKISSGANAIPILLAILPFGRFASSLILRFPPGRHIVNFLYSTLSRLHDTGSCSYKPSNSRSLSIDLENFSVVQKNAKDRVNYRLPKY